VGIGTSRGFRVGTIADNGQITYGPLIIEPDNVQGCTALCAQGRFFVVAFRTTNGEALAYRVDTGTPLENGVFPYAADIQIGNPNEATLIGAITSLAAPANNRLVACATDGLTWYQGDMYVTSGWIQTGRIRYRTTELKQFKRLSVEIEPLNGAIQVDLIKEGGSTLPLGNITKSGEVFADHFDIEDESMRYASIKFTLTPPLTSAASPVINSYQLRALPAITPQRMITLPLLCFDREQARSGQWYGGAQFAADRLAALQMMEDAATTVLYQNLTGLDDSGFQVIIESLRYVETAPGLQRTTFASGNGGIIIAQLRTL
jgi:hypothetical protein